MKPFLRSMAGERRRAFQLDHGPMAGQFLQDVPGGDPASLDVVGPDVDQDVATSHLAVDGRHGDAGAVQRLDRRRQGLGPDRRHQHPVHPLRDEVFHDRHLLGRHVFGVRGNHFHAEFLGFVLDVILDADEERMGEGGNRQPNDQICSLPGHRAMAPRKREPRQEPQCRQAADNPGPFHGINFQLPYFRAYVLPYSSRSA